MDKLKQLRSVIKEKGLEALLLSDIQDVNWLTGFSGSFGAVLVTESQGLFISDSRYTVQAAEEVKTMPTKTFASPQNFYDFLAAQVQELGIKLLGFDSNETSVAKLKRMETSLANVQLVPAESLTQKMRMVKSPDEIERAKRACALADACFDHVRRLIQPGSIEYDLGLEIEFFFRRQGAELAFAPIVVSGLRSARPHGHPSENRLQEGDFVTMDFGAKVEGFCSDITRTIVVSHASERHIEVYNRVLKAQIAAIKAIKPGALAKDVDSLAREELGDLAQYFGHGLGHGLGGVVHDLGRMAQSSQDIFEPGQIWTVEPGVYIEGFGGVRIEDDVLVTESGVEVLTHSPKELLVLP